jgi:flagellar protein FlbD
MIRLTKLTGEVFYMNPETLRFVEDCGDTMITLITGERILVRERVREVCKFFIEYKKAMHNSLPYEDFQEEFSVVGSDKGETDE